MFTSLLLLLSTLLIPPPPPFFYLQTRATNLKIFEIPFNSTHKWQLSLHQAEGGKGLLLVLKGAPERVIAKCSKILLNGEVFIPPPPSPSPPFFHLI